MEVILGFFSISVVIVFDKSIGALLFDAALSILVEVVFKFERSHIL